MSHEWVLLEDEYEYCAKCRSIRPLDGTQFVSEVSCEKLGKLIASHEFGQEVRRRIIRGKLECADVRCIHCRRRTTRYYHPDVPFPMYIDAIGDCKKIAMRRALGTQTDIVFLSWYKWIGPIRF